MRFSRLTGKILKPSMDQSMLELMIERLGIVQQLDAIVLATTTDLSCEPVEELALSLGVGATAK